jgi:RNA polymerase sigma factor (sigma-70 family)
MHQMMNALRSKRRRPQTAGDAALEFEADQGSTGRADALEYEYVYACLERLDQIQASIIRLKHFSALTFEEIAARNTMSPNSVKTLYYRGLARLRGLLGPHLREELA